MEEMSDEEFRDCPYTNFQASQYGRIKRKDSDEILEPEIFQRHYIVREQDGGDSFERVHRLVALAWLKESYKRGMDVHHKDYNNLNNRADNLEWMEKIEHLEKRHCVQIGE
jgi:hypothetical protein